MTELYIHVHMEGTRSQINFGLHDIDPCNSKVKLLTVYIRVLLVTTSISSQLLVYTQKSMPAMLVLQ